MNANNYFSKVYINTATVMLIFLLCSLKSIAGTNLKNDQSPDSLKSTSASLKKGTINYTVTVTGKKTSQPLQYAIVALKKGNNKIARSATNPFGRAIFDDLEEGNYILQTNLIGYKDYIDTIQVDSFHKSLEIKLSEMSLELNEVVIQGLKHNMDRLGTLSDIIQPTSEVTTEAIYRKNADDFTQAVTSEPGVCVLTGCSSCGFKQIQINGLGANHTTMLVDGLPIYTPVTSFYGVDALTTAGVAAIDISRGPGASLLSPGAMGGAVDVRFQDPTKTTITGDAAIGNNDWNHLSISAATVIDSGKLGILIAAHHFQQGAWDINGNGVCESPSLKDESALLRLNGIIDENFSWNLRFTHSNSEVFGASTTSNHMGATIGPADSIPLFVGGNVKNAFIGNPIDIIEWVQTVRDEVAGSLTWDSPGIGLWQLRAGLANQSQTSEYEGGADYYNMDRNVVGDLRWQTTIGDHTLTLGVDGNSERMASQSIYYYQKLGIIPDSYNTVFGGGYVQDVWNFGHERDLSMALRLDDIDVNWVDKPNSEIHNFIAAPRVSLRWEFIEGLTGRLSAGLGWRAPLTFFQQVGKCRRSGRFAFLRPTAVELYRRSLCNESLKS